MEPRWRTRTENPSAGSATWTSTALAVKRTVAVPPGVGIVTNCAGPSATLGVVVDVGASVVDVDAGTDEEEDEDDGVDEEVGVVGVVAVVAVVAVGAVELGELVAGAAEPGARPPEVDAPVVESSPAAGSVVVVVEEDVDEVEVAVVAVVDELVLADGLLLDVAVDVASAGASDRSSAEPLWTMISDGEIGLASDRAADRTESTPAETTTTAPRVAAHHSTNPLMRGRPAPTPFDMDEPYRRGACPPTRPCQPYDHGVPTVYLVEDDIQIRSALATALAERGFAVHVSATGLDAIAPILELQPDAVVLDLGLPDIDGATLLSMLRAASDVPVIVATARADETEIVKLLDAGADDYLVKPFSAEQLAARLRAVARRSVGAESEPSIVVGGLRIDAGARLAELDGVPLDLARREFDLLLHLARRAGQVVSRSELLAEVWRQPFGGSDKTLDVHLSWLRRKLGESAAAPRYLHTSRGVGVRLSPPTDAGPTSR